MSAPITTAESEADFSSWPEPSVEAFYARIHQAWLMLPAELRAELAAWEAEHVDGGGKGTSDWPGWGDIVPGWHARQRRLTDPPVPPTYKKASIPARLRWEIWERDGFTCRHCGTRSNLSVDHIVPESRGGTLAPDNLQTLCRPCNSRKGVR